MTSSVILNYMKTPKFYLIDSWGKDIIKDKDETYHKYATYEQAKRVFAKFKKAKLIHGVVPQILYKMDIKNVSYLHLDLNSWRADLSALEYFWDKLLIGAIVIVDDFGFDGFEKTRKHIENFVKKKHTDIMYTALGPGIIVKT